MANLWTVRISEQCCCPACLEHCLFQAQQKLRWKIWHPTSRLRIHWKMTWDSLTIAKNSYIFPILLILPILHPSTSNISRSLPMLGSGCLKNGWNEQQSAAHSFRGGSAIGRKQSPPRILGNINTAQKITNRPRSYPNQSQSQSQ